ncbi:MAG: Crp/Fnr family transcriptional regulator [Actinobacteria bacterium]|nr:Crp/Fnr family transcriptional regulator [Actinomycetota bacterium]
MQKAWAAGETIFRQGHQPEALFIIEQGEVALVDETKNERRIVQIVGLGSLIGESPVLQESPYVYTAVARTNATTLGFALDTIRALLEIDPQICFRWLRLLSERLDGSQRRLVAVAGRSAIERLGVFLLQDAGDGAEVTVELTQQELASTLGIGRQTVSRVLGNLERLGLIERGRGQVRILDPDGLRALLPH